MTIERKQAYTEILQILNILGNNYSKKVPDRVKEYFQNNCSKNYKFHIDSGNSISEQITNPITINLLGMLRYNYWSNSENEKQQLSQKFLENDNIKEKELREKYNTENLFGSKNQATIQQTVINQNNIALEEVKESIFNKLFRKLKNIFHIR